MRWLLLGVLLAACDDGGADVELDAAAGSDARAEPDAAGDQDAVADAASADVALGPDLGLADNFGVAETEGGPGCEGLDTTSCILPFPSDLYLNEGAIRFPPDVLPAHRNGTPMKPDLLAFSDGWGVATPIMVHLDGADLSALPPVFEPAASLAPDAATIVLNTTTGERTAHWAEVDHMTRDAEHPIVILRPAAPLAFGTRYIVAVRGLRDPSGDPWLGAAGFAAIRDGVASHSRGVHARRDDFAVDIFPALDAAGFSRDTLDLAWSFTTASETNTRSTLLHVRDVVLAALPPDGPEVGIESSEPDPHPAIRRTMEGVMTVPSVLGAQADDRLRRFQLGADGRPEIAGAEAIPFTLQLPAGRDDETLTPVLIYGHGLLGSRDEANGGYLRTMAQTYGFAILAIDMQGMSEVDGGYWFFNLATQAGNFPAFTHAAIQGVINHLVLARLAQRGIPGAGALDPQRVWYYGNSQGGTMGTLIMAASPDLPRGVLGVPGGSFPFLLQRAAGFAQLLGPLQNAFADPTAASIVLGLLGTGFSQLEPLAFAGLIHPDRQVLLHVARADAQVHNQISFQLARAVGATLATPAVRPVFGLDERPYPFAGSAIVEHDFLKPPNPDPSAPKPEMHDTHEDLRRSRPAQDQLMHYLESGEVINPCVGPCDPG